MEYSIQSLSKLSGVTPRTLRYYDSIGLLKPQRITEAGYRWYGETELRRLQQILFYRELSFPLKEISVLLGQEEARITESLIEQLVALKQEKARVARLIQNLESTIQERQGGIGMSDQKRFEGFKQECIKENRKKYGNEIEEKYGAKRVAESERQFANMSMEESNLSKQQEADFIVAIRKAMEKKDATCPEAIRGCELHRQWLSHYWKEQDITPEAHLGLALGYQEDERFRAYYAKHQEGFAEFFYQALTYYYHH